MKKTTLILLYSLGMLLTAFPQEESSCEHYDTREVSSIQSQGSNPDFHLVRICLICNVCGAEVGESQELEEPHLWQDTYSGNGDETHSLVQSCELCGYNTGSTEPEPCSYYLEHIGYRILSASEHLHEYKCTLCGQTVSLPESHGYCEYDAQNNEICSDCGQLMNEAVEEIEEYEVSYEDDPAYPEDIDYTQQD